MKVARQRDAALWNGVRTRTLRVAVEAFDDEAAPARFVTVPVGWNDEAAAALARLAPGHGAVALSAAAAHWINPLAAHPGAGADLAQRLVVLLLRQAAAPDESVWRAAAQDTASFVLNLAAFAAPGAGFDLEFFVTALQTAAETLRLLGSRRPLLLLGNLDACLAGLGLDYDSEAARDVAACLTALASATVHPGTVARHAGGAMPPQHYVVAGLAPRAGAAWRQALAAAAEMGVDEQAADLFASASPCQPGRIESGRIESGRIESGRIETGFSSPGPADALLGAEACGLAPVFSPLTPDGRLAASTLARLAARGISPEAAFAASLAGATVLREATHAAVQAMQGAVTPFIDRAAIHVVSAPPAKTATLGAPVRRELPARHGGFTQKAAVDGHRLFLRTGEYADGSLGELAISPVRDSPAQRGLMEAFCQSVNLGLQHGVPLEAYVDAFAYTRFGPHGAVEGDATVTSATSLLDYAFRTLAQAYLGRSLPDAPRQPEDPRVADDTLLPLDLPRSGNAGVRQRHGLRLVG